MAATFEDDYKPVARSLVDPSLMVYLYDDLADHVDRIDDGLMATARETALDAMVYAIAYRAFMLDSVANTHDALDELAALAETRGL